MPLGCKYRAKTPGSTQPPSATATATHSAPNHTSTEDATLPDTQELELELASTSSTSLPRPIVEIVVGKDDNQTVLTALQTLLLESPFLVKLVQEFEASGPVSRSCIQIKLPEEDVDAFGCDLQFQYTRDYTVPQPDSTDPAVNYGSETLLRHARIYTLADKLGLPALKSLAHSKIHKVKSSPHAEHLYARCVYTNTPASDTTIRKPVASYWASHSHTLRRDVGDDSRTSALRCLRSLSMSRTIILDRKEKQIPSDEIKGSARKRRRDL
ncbi:hypothetical protein N7508_010014 [Penicillium antarcticum]|uniref:uncharacterized protein n=1 Tax=Penicillium antarcticum TaxID=416450 RepID=UPI002399F4B4|nr:uncharacterized protein N7508_010014 [Penicillium antarcticum]KAJ5295193.1 hypothetical protein N7508_010014 [Penicillium antarcticum]